MKIWPLFDFGLANQVWVAPIISDADYHQQISIWISGRLLGFRINLEIPWRKRL